jgi:hypothetical protein
MTLLALSSPVTSSLRTEGAAEHDAAVGRPRPRLWSPADLERLLDVLALQVNHRRPRPGRIVRLVDAETPTRDQPRRRSTRTMSRNA